MSNKTLHEARKRKSDEFYTSYRDIERELVHYKDQLAGKVIYCNTDTPTSNFVKFLIDVFKDWELGGILCTSIHTNTVWGYDGQWYEDRLPGPGDYTSPWCIDLMKQADVVITNPPFSKFREYFSLLVKHANKYLVMGNFNTSVCGGIFEYIKKNQTHLGYTYGLFTFEVPTDYPKLSKDCFEKDGKKYIHVPTVCWYTNLQVNKPPLHLTKKYSPEKYPKYDNYDAIEVGRVKDIPCDYRGVMGVPITFLLHHNPKQFEIVGFCRPQINNKKMYVRILIKRCDTLAECVPIDEQPSRKHQPSRHA